ncbi:hypothetical protein C8J57DRAFT_1649160 [Mycena rebaudengoi]|nr:hypothetical protein C8J57DRAFT_1649160 [Mycena rebaudengoi]
MSPHHPTSRRSTKHNRTLPTPQNHPFVYIAPRAPPANISPRRPRACLAAGVAAGEQTHGEDAAHYADDEGAASARIPLSRAPSASCAACGPGNAPQLEERKTRRGEEVRCSTPTPTRATPIYPALFHPHPRFPIGVGYMRTSSRRSRIPDSMSSSTSTSRKRRIPSTSCPPPTPASPRNDWLSEVRPCGNTSTRRPSHARAISLQTEHEHEETAPSSPTSTSGGEQTRNIRPPTYAPARFPSSLIVGYPRPHRGGEQQATLAHYPSTHLRPPCALCTSASPAARKGLAAGAVPSRGWARAVLASSPSTAWHDGARVQCEDSMPRPGAAGGGAEHPYRRKRGEHHLAMIHAKEVEEVVGRGGAIKPYPRRGGNTAVCSRSSPAGYKREECVPYALGLRIYTLGGRHSIMRDCDAWGQGRRRGAIRTRTRSVEGSGFAVRGSRLCVCVALRRGRDGVGELDLYSRRGALCLIEWLAHAKSDERPRCDDIDEDMKGILPGVSRCRASSGWQHSIEWALPPLKYEDETMPQRVEDSRRRYAMETVAGSMGTSSPTSWILRYRAQLGIECRQEIQKRPEHDSSEGVVSRSHSLGPQDPRTTYPSTNVSLHLQVQILPTIKYPPLATAANELERPKAFHGRVDLIVAYDLALYPTKGKRDSESEREKWGVNNSVINSVPSAQVVRPGSNQDTGRRTDKQKIPDNFRDDKAPVEVKREEA